MNEARCKKFFKASSAICVTKFPALKNYFFSNNRQQAVFRIQQSPKNLNVNKGAQYQLSAVFADTQYLIGD